MKKTNFTRASVPEYNLILKYMYNKFEKIYKIFKIDQYLYCFIKEITDTPSDMVLTNLPKDILFVI